MRYFASNSGNLAREHPLSPLARSRATLPPNTTSSVDCIHTRIVTSGFAPPTRACRSSGNDDTAVHQGRVRAGWHPLAVDHTYVDWIGHCTPSAQFLNKETASTATILFNRIRTNATTRTFRPSSCNVQYERQSRFLTDKIALEFLSIPTPEADRPSHASINRDIDEMQTLQFHSLE